MAELVVSLNGKPALRFNGPRDMLLMRAKMLAKALDTGEARFLVDGEELPMTAPPGRAAHDPPESPGAIPLHPCAEIIAEEVDVEDSDEAEESPEPPTAAPASSSTDARPLVPMDHRVMSLEDAARVSKELLSRTVHLHDKMLDRAADRSVKLFDSLNSQLEKATERTVRQAVELQEFVGNMNATLAQERVAAFKLRSAQEEIDRRDAQREYARQLALAEANRPNAATILAELAVGFAGHFAMNAANNFAVMNPQNEEN